MGLAAKTRLIRAARGALAALALGFLAACDNAPPSWEKLLAAKIVQQYPHYRVVPDGSGNGVVVARPGLANRAIDVAAIGRYCQRGNKDCNHAIDQMLLELAPPVN